MTKILTHLFIATPNKKENKLMFTKRDICTEKVTIDYSYYSFDEETDRLYKHYTDKGYYIVDITPLGESSYLNRNRHFLVRYVKPKYHVHQKTYYNATINYTAPGQSLGTFTTKEDAEQCRKEHALENSIPLSYITVTEESPLDLPL